MKILAVDTAVKSCSVAIVDKESVLAEITLCREQTHSKHLMEMINAAIKLSGIIVSELDGFAVTRGPGSFTGLRIGISSIKGLAAATRKPLVGVSSLDALAMQCFFSQYLICSLLDACGGEVYFSRYRFKGNILKKEIDEQVLPPGKAVCDINEASIFVGDGAFAYQKVIRDKLGALAHFALPYQSTIRASTIANIGMDRFKNNDTDDISDFVPFYIRKSYAKLSR
ncbi:MAG: tRNA (adenosine(37)-N6)-threonylcarbamoyltransferase complex dimerization subunit type 1 TsaB [Thermodesulfobacteriota bacterium]|nr:tRNA (adenosine(37)-N6)-threonylcarbamoyltransferase complex dimerization subunit type 1 TsaB [Thermodesulfobacteriota bacterium]